PTRAGRVRRRAWVLLRDLPPERLQRARDPRGDGAGQPFALAARGRAGNALPDRAGCGQARPVRPRRDPRRARRHPSRLAHVRRMGGVRAVRREHADRLLPDRVRARLLHALRAGRRHVQAEQLLRGRDRSRDQVRRSRRRDLMACRAGALGAGRRRPPAPRRRRGAPVRVRGGPTAESMRSRSILVVALLAGAALTAAAALAAVGAGSTIWTIAGAGSACSTPPSCGDGSAATRALLSFPEAVAVSTNGNVYVSDWGANEIRK